MKDYESEASKRITSVFEDKPMVREVIVAMPRELTSFEQTADQVRDERSVDNAIGIQLEGVGEIVGESRQGRDDEAYRLAIKFRIFANISSGTPTNLIQGLKLLTSPTDCQYLESYPATALLFSNGFFIDNGIQVAMQDISPAAIATIPIAVSFMDRPFRFGMEAPPGELFVNSGNSYLEANGSDIKVTLTSAAIDENTSTFGGIVPAELAVGAGEIYLDVGGPTLAVYNPDSLHTLGHHNLTGVFQ